MLPEVRGQLRSMTNQEINQALKAFLYQHTTIGFASIHSEEPYLALR